MIIPVPKARRKARTYLAERGDFDMSLTRLHYLGLYKRRHAFEVRTVNADDLCVDKALPIVLIVTTKEVQYFQSYISLDIMYFVWEKKKKY